MVNKTIRALRTPLLGAALAILGFTLSAWAEEMKGPPGPPPPIAAEKMEAVRACAKAKGVDLPAPPAAPPAGEAPPTGQQPPAPPPEGAGGPGKLTDAQRAIVDACFTANGIQPPKGPPHHR